MTASQAIKAIYTAYHRNTISRSTRLYCNCHHVVYRPGLLIYATCVEKIPAPNTVSDECPIRQSKVNAIVRAQLAYQGLTMKTKISIQDKFGSEPSLYYEYDDSPVYLSFAVYSFRCDIRCVDTVAVLVSLDHVIPPIQAESMAAQQSMIPLTADTGGLLLNTVANLPGRAMI